MRMQRFKILVLEGGGAGASLDTAKKTDAGGAASGGDSWASSPGTWEIFCQSARPSFQTDDDAFKSPLLNLALSSCASTGEITNR